MLQGFQKSNRIRDFNVGDCLTIGEIKDFFKDFQDDEVVVLKCGKKNFRVADFEKIQNKPVLIGQR